MTHHCQRNENSHWHKNLSTNVSNSLVGTNLDVLQSKLWPSLPWITLTGKNHRHATPGWFSRELFSYSARKQPTPKGYTLCTYNNFKATCSRKGDELVVVRSWGGMWGWEQRTWRKGMRDICGDENARILTGWKSTRCLGHFSALARRCHVGTR